MAELQIPSLTHLLGHSYQHEGSHKNGNKAKKYNRKNRGGKKCHHDSTNKFLKEFQNSIQKFNY